MDKSLSLLTSPAAVKAAIAECDKLGHQEFLARYGYKKSRRYPLYYGGKVYDSKAIIGVAFGKQHGESLKSTDFSGGAATVVPVLNRLGFSANLTPPSVTGLVRGATYTRKYLQEHYGGQIQSGIWTPSNFPAVFIFTGDSGKAYGYSDGWDEDGIFHYTGEGQVGDMKFERGNKAIRDHQKNCKDLFLFEDLGKGNGVRYAGLFECASWYESKGPDKNNLSRKVIVFNLVPVETAAIDTAILTDVAQSTEGQSYEDLRAAAYAAASAGKQASKTGNAKQVWRERSAKVRDYVLARANGICEACGQRAPFLKNDGNPYLETHHTQRLADEGPDHPVWVGAICPTCHRRIHSGADGREWNKILQGQLNDKEKSREV